nr:major capsid protein [uncultured Oscillibacter sp.]
MPNTVSIYEPRTMMGVIRKLPPVHTFFRSTFFSREKTFVTKSVDMDYKKGARKLAPFVSREIGGKVVPNTGYTTETYTPPFIAPDRVTTIDDILDRQPGESLYSGRTPAQRAVIQMSEDFTDLREMILRREEWMCAQAMLTGKIVVLGEGVKDTIDFRFTNLIDISKDAKRKWKGGTVQNKYADLKAWHEKVQKEGFTNCNVCIMASDVVTEFLMDEQIRKLLDVKNYALAVIKPTQKENNVTYIGTIHELGLDLYQYNEWYVDDWTDPATPVELPMVPAGTLMMASTHAKYSMYYGAISILNQKTEKWETVAGKYVPDTFIKKRPDRRFLSLQSAPVPVPHEVDSWLVAKVF